MLRFARFGIVPPGGKYLYDVGNLVLSHPSRIGLFQQLHAYYRSNNLPVPENLEALVEDYMCRILPPKFCAGDDEGKPRKRVATLKDIRESTMKFLATPGFADNGTALERAVRCAKCTLNDRSACPTCTGLVAWGVRQAGGRELPGYGDVLGVCEKDLVLMSAGVFAKTAGELSDAPPNCWRGKQ